MALSTGAGPGTMVGGKTVDKMSQSASSAAMERTLWIVFIANEVGGNDLQHAVADDFVDQIQIVLLNCNLFGVPLIDDIRRHLLLKEPPRFGIRDVDALRILVPN